MPLRDHFVSSNDPFRLSESILIQWTGTIIAELHRVIPKNFASSPRFVPPYIPYEESDKAISTWKVTRPSLEFSSDWSESPTFEIHINDHSSYRRLAAVIKFVGPRDKETQKGQALFLDRCSAFLQDAVSLTIIDVVTRPNGNLYVDLLDRFGQSDPCVPHPRPNVYAASLRTRPLSGKILVESWYEPVSIGTPLPVMPIWLTECLAIRLDLDPIYEQTLKDLRIA